MTDKRSTFDKIIEKANDAIFGKDTGVSVSEGAKGLQQHRNRIDEVNRQLEDTSPGDTDTTKQIFEK
jgi:hypothetical protein